MRKIVIHGIVEVMNEEQIKERSEGLRGALSRISNVRDQREQLAAKREEVAPKRESILARRRQRDVFSFTNRARGSVDVPEPEDPASD